MKLKKHLLTALWGALFLLWSVAPLLAQNRRQVYEEYVQRHRGIAQEHQAIYKIPSSITLAQGLLESAAGQSELARRSNNHFGIKCHNSWTGGRVYAKDDNPNDCFRKYDRVEDSYADRAIFLSRQARYRRLFDLEVTDYKGWAKGLQTAGYATDKAYANKLIKLIEDYELFLWDKPSSYAKASNKQKKQKGEKQIVTNPHTPYRTHGLVYVIARRGDTFEAIANEFGFKAKNLYKWNEVPEGFPLSEGDIVYFQRKKSKADKPYYEHEVKVGESMHSISQLYGMKVKNLYRLNKKDGEYVPEEGDVLRLR